MTTTNFNNVFNKIETTLSEEATLRCENGTGYFDHMTKLAIDVDMVKFTDRHGRRGIVMRTTHGNVVYFQRNVGGDAFAFNVPRALNDLFTIIAPSNRINDDRLADLIGQFEPENRIGALVDGFANMATHD